MWPDKTYVLFTYERLRDVRLVYAPPMALGCFGGDTDNFEWPRHTADFTLLRAYVAPDGSAAEYSPDNVPYAPEKFLRAAPDGAAPGDFVFLLGFPGSTMRYAPASRLSYSDEVAVPQLVSDFGAKLELIATHATDRAAALKMASARKGLANEYKRSVGKRVMMRKLKLEAERKAEEASLCAAAPEAAETLAELEGVYAELRRRAPLSEALDAMRGIYHGSTLLAVGHALHEGSVEAAKADGERETEYRSRNLPFMVKRLAKRLADLHPPHEAALLRRAAAAAGRLPLGLLPKDYLQQMQLLTKTVNDLEGLAVSLESGTATSKIVAMSADDLTAALGGDAPPPEDELAVRVAAALHGAYREDRDASKALLATRDKLLAKLLEVQQAHAADGRVLPRCERLLGCRPATSRATPRRMRWCTFPGDDARRTRRQAPRGDARLRRRRRRRRAGRRRVRRAGEAGRAVRERSGGGGDAGVHPVLDRHGGRQLGLSPSSTPTAASSRSTLIGSASG